LRNVSKWVIGRVIGTVIWFPDNNELHYAYGHVTPFGTIEIKVNRNDMSVTHIKYSGSFNDIYDFEYNFYSKHNYNVPNRLQSLFLHLF